jgi:hypothetical protein
VVFGDREHVDGEVTGFEVGPHWGTIEHVRRHPDFIEAPQELCWGFDNQETSLGLDQVNT